MFAVTLPPMLARKLRDESEGEALFEEMESRFASCMELPIEEARRIEHADIVVGIPFYDEAKALPHVVQTAIDGLQEFFPQATSVVIAVGAPTGREALDAVQQLPRGGKVGQISFLLEDGQLEGKGWGVRAILTLADKLGADVALLEADLATRTREGDTHGLTPEWVRMLLEPIRSDEFDMVISSFDIPPFDSPLSGQLAHPLLAAVYGCPIRCVLGGQWGIARPLLPTYLTNPHYAWETESSGYGVDSWLATAAIVRGAKICEAHLGTKLLDHGALWPCGERQRVVDEIPCSCRVSCFNQTPCLGHGAGVFLGLTGHRTGGARPEVQRGIRRLLLPL
jgi:hypothetical protein